MDKLKPLLENKFWIFLFLAILLPTIGWLVASGTFADEIEKREGELKSAFDKLDFPPDVPNKSWEDGVQTLVLEEQARLDQTSVSLWETQKLDQDWPANVQDLMKDVPYQGTIPNQALEYYRRVGNGYEKQLDDIEAILEPYDPVKRTGKVLIDRSVYTHVPIGTWKSSPPTSKAMWNAQIDVWLVRSIFRAIATMNRADEKLSDSTIVQVLELTLRGGIRDYAASAGTAGAADGSATPTGASEGYGDDMYAGGGAGGYGGDGGNLGNVGGKLQFDLSDELGPDAGSRGGSSGYSGADGGYGAADASAATAEPGASGAAAATQGPRRYVDDDETLPFRTRGFVLGVVMHHRYLNDFLAELSGSNWPIQVIRVHQQMNNPDSLAPSDRLGSQSRGSSRGYPPSSGYGSGTSGGFGSTGEYGAGGNPSESGFGGSTLSRPGTGSRGTGVGSAANDLMIQQALSDPHLATVWIGGLITLFKPVDEPGAGQTPPVDSVQDSVPETSEPIEPTTATEADPENPETPASDTETPADTNETTDPKANENPETPQPAPETPQPATDDTPSAPADTEPAKPPEIQE